MASSPTSDAEKTPETQAARAAIESHFAAIRTIVETHDGARKTPDETLAVLYAEQALEHLAAQRLDGGTLDGFRDSAYRQLFFDIRRFVTTRRR